MMLIDLINVAIADRSFSPKEREQFHRIGPLLGFPDARADESIHTAD
jgi:tellurite resistance protein